MDLTKPYTPAEDSQYIFEVPGDVIIPRVMAGWVGIWVAMAITFASFHRLPPITLAALPFFLGTGIGAFLVSVAFTVADMWTGRMLSERKMRREYARLKARGDLSEVQCRYLADRAYCAKNDFAVEESGTVRLQCDGYEEVIAPDGHLMRYQDGAQIHAYEICQALA